MSVKIPSFFTMPYSSGPNIMTSRDHIFNKSTRPLLMERKPQLLLKKKLSEPGKLHGFDDFDQMSQQYKYINTHIGYPYGSPPPSPTVNSNDFVFSDTIGVRPTPVPSSTLPVPSHHNKNHHTLSNRNQFYRSKSNSSSNNSTCSLVKGKATTKPYPPSAVDEDNYYTSACEPHSNFNDIESWRSNSQVPQVPQVDQQHDPQLDNISSGPFIFGIHTANILTEKPPSPNQPTVINSNTNFTKQGHLHPHSHPAVAFNQSNSDTSSSSKNSEKDSKFLVKCRRKSTKRNFKEQTRPKIKCVVVGDGTVGKTNLIVSYLENRFIAEHVPTASDIYNAEVMVNDSPVHVTLCDTAGQDTLDQLRELCYPDSDVFLLCFSVVKPETFHSIKTKWAPKFSKTKAALILVGTQADLRGDIKVLNKLQTNGKKPIAFTDAWDLANTIGAKYIETSSFTQEKVKDVFDAAIWEALIPTKLPPKPPLWKRIFCLV